MASDDRGLSPDGAFWLLGEDTRLSILRAVHESPDETVSFTEIRERVGNPDSGSFNYHLGKLAGHFLARGDGGYRLTQAGREVVRAVLAGTITERPSTDPVPIDATCVECGGELVAGYDEYAVVECGDCGATVMWNEFPPAGLASRTPAEVAAAFDRWTRSRFRLATEGICPSCAAEMSATLVGPGTPGGEEAPGSGGDAGIATEHRCTNCGYEARVPLVGHVLDHPAVVSFYHDGGVDATDLPYWEMQALAREFGTAVVSRDPWRVRVAIDAHGSTLGLVLDDRLDVVEVEPPEG